MPRYQITAPDGREVVIEGERPPTQEDALKIFATLPPKAATPEKAAAASSEESQSITKRVLNALTAGIPDTGDMREFVRTHPDAALSANTELGTGGLTIPETEQAAKTTAATGLRIAAPIGGFFVGGAPGAALAGAGGEFLAQQIEGGKTRPGAIFASGIASGIPGAPLASRGIARMVLEGAKQGAGGILAKTAETAIDEGRLPTAREAVFSTALPAAGGALAQRIQADNPRIQAAVLAADTAPGATKRATLEAAKELGYAIVPSDVNPSFLNKRIESLAGPADVRRAAAIKNQDVTNRAAAADIGISPKVELTQDVIEDVRAAASRPYQEVATLSPTAAQNLQDLRDARHEASLQFGYYKKSGLPEALRKADAAKANVQALEAALEIEATGAGRPELVPQLRKARETIAKTYDIEHAMNEGDASISAPALGRALQSGRPLSGNLENIALVAKAFPRMVPEGAKQLKPGLSYTDWIMGPALASALFGATQHPAAAAAVLAPPVVRAGAKRLVLSRPYQALMTDLPPPAIEATPDAIASAVRLLAQTAAVQQPTDTIAAEPEKKTAAAERTEEAPKPDQVEEKKKPRRKFKVVEDR